MTTTKKFRKLSALALLTSCGVNGFGAAANAADTEQADSLTQMFIQGKVSGYLHSLYFSTNNAFYVPGKDHIAMVHECVFKQSGPESDGSVATVAG